MELPIFQDNLRSSADWVAALSRARDRRREAVASDTELRAREKARQAAQIAQRTRQQGIELDEANLPAAARLVSAWASDVQAMLTLPRLIELNRAVIGSAASSAASPGTDSQGAVWRTTAAVRLNEAHDPPPAVMLPRLVENALDWFSTAGFAEMNPVEQAALVYLRLLDLQPFALAQEPTALLAASFYTERAGLPPLIVEADKATLERYNAALAAAFRMLTQPLVEFFAGCLIQTVNLTLSGDRR